MSAATYDLYIEKGSTFSRTLSITFSDSSTDISGYTFKSQIRIAKLKTSTLIIDITATIIDAASGVLQLSLTPTQTTDITYDYGYWDLEMEKTSDGSITRLLNGSVTFDDEVTI